MVLAMTADRLEGGGEAIGGFGRREYGPVELRLKAKVIVKMIGAWNTGEGLVGHRKTLTVL
jgi:hypothetical protein